jgi:indolepyruvate ferredoxin oxidoreductase, beta subunit
MGGEGGGVLADWLVDLAEHNGYLAQTTSVPGVAQRTGATIYYLEMFPAAQVPEGHLPVMALSPFPGAVDIVVASELMEAGRALQRQLVSPDRTTLIASTHRVYSMTERMALADGRVDASQLLAGAQQAAKQWIGADFAVLAEGSGSPIGAALYGAIAASGPPALWACRVRSHHRAQRLGCGRQPESFRGRMAGGPGGWGRTGGGAARTGGRCLASGRAAAQ